MSIQHTSTIMTTPRKAAAKMRASTLFTAFTLAVVALSGCAEAGPDINRVQTNLVDKEIFEGEWWYTRTVVGLDDDGAWAISAAGASAPWVGAMANFDIVSQSGTIGRIRWVIDQNLLFAYRANEVISGANADPDSPEFRGAPLAIFPIQSHVDVRQQYSLVTGEQTNVISESQDRRWYDRQFMRIDWSQNLVTWGLFGAGLEIEELFATFHREPVQNFVQEGGDSRTPDSWRPQFVTVGEDTDYRFRDEWPAENEDTTHYMSFVTNELWTPNNCPADACRTSVRVSLRHAFLRVPPNHEYAAETLPNTERDRFGIIRTESRTYIRGGGDRSELGGYCDARCLAACTFDDDCGTGGLCDGGQCTAGIQEDVDDCGSGTMCDYTSNQCEGNIDSSCGPGLCNTEDNLCEGGLNPEFGETDFLTFYRLRHNFYSDSLDETRSCIADWQCDNRHDTIPGADPAMTQGSTCDRAAGLCTIPLRSRPLREVRYHLSPQFPTHLVRSSFEVVSQWNESFMHGNRALHGLALPEGGPVACQDVDPTEYCYCGDTARALEVNADNTCTHRSDLFVPPTERGESDPYDCWIGIMGDDGTVVRETEGNNPSHPTAFGGDTYTSDVYRYAFTGTECMLTLHNNSCDFPVSGDAQPAACEELGDIRYQFFNYASGAGAGWCGVMQPLQDPTNGEAISIPINMGGLCLDRIATNAIDLWPVLRGDASEDTLFTGENVRGYFERLGNTHVPVGLSNPLDGSELNPSDPSRPAVPTNLNAHLNEMFERMTPRVESLRQGNGGALNTFSHRQRSLVGTDMERRLVEGLRLEGMTAMADQNPLMAVNMGAEALSHGTSAEAMEALSPFREGFDSLNSAETRREAALERNFVLYPHDGLYTSRYNQFWAEAFRGASIAEANVRWQQAFFRAVMLHELGHGLGLEHNFAGSYDRDNYGDGYFNLITQTDGSGNHLYDLPRLTEFDCGNDTLCPGAPGYPGRDDGEADGALTGAENASWVAELRRVRTERLNLGTGNYSTSSIMDYGGDLSDMSGLGRYDKAAVYFNYFNQVETYQGNPLYTAGAGNSLSGLLRPDTTPRQLWSYYRGGDACDIDTDCPNARGSANLAEGQRVFQRCVRNPRFSQIPIACEGDSNCVCSNFDEDMTDLIEGAGGYDWDTTGPDGTPDGVSDFDRVDYLFCSNGRLGDISWCNVFDAGESFQETIDHFRQTWTENYPRNYFRNYRRGFGSGSRAGRGITVAAKIYQHLFFRYFFEPNFRDEIGPLGFNDQFLASTDAMNWLAELAQMPDVGSYHLNETTNSYEHMGNELDMPGSDINLELGQGYYTWSRYQDGLYGFFRMQRAGVFWDKLTALRALTVRDWGTGFGRDERYQINFYDLYPVEMTELFGGYILDDDRWMAPRVRIDDEGDANVYYLNYNRGSCRDAGGEFVPCRGPNAEVFTDPSIGDTSNDVLRLFASIYALSEFPIYYDPSFESRLAVFRLDSSEGFTIPDIQSDGEVTCGLDSIIPGSGHVICDDAAEADYLIYNSDRLHTPYVAVKIRNRLTYNLEEEQLGFQLLVHLRDRQAQIRALEAVASPTTEQRQELSALRQRLQGDESFLEALIEVQRSFGINSI